MANNCYAISVQILLNKYYLHYKKKKLCCYGASERTNAARSHTQVLYIKVNKKIQIIYIQHKMIFFFFGLIYNIYKLYY